MGLGIEIEEGGHANIMIIDKKNKKIERFEPNGKKSGMDNVSYLLPKLKEGMIFTVEPMLNVGTDKIKILKDGWTAVTQDKKLSAQFEHTIGVTENGYEIFTLSPKNYHKPPY